MHATARHTTAPAITSPSEASTPVAETAATLGATRAVDRRPSVSRVRSLALPLVLVAVILYIDSLTHPAPAFQIIVGLLVAVVLLFGGRVLDSTGLRPHTDQIPPKVRPIVLAIPPTIWFAAREEGTSGSGAAVALVGLALVAVISFFGDELDRPLARFFAARDRLLSHGVRLVLAVVVPLVIAFAVIHGSLLAVPVLFRGTTSSYASAQDRTDLIVLGSLISGILTFLLLREREQ